MTRFTIVPREPSEEMTEAAIHKTGTWADCYRAMLAARPALTDEDIAALCAMFWPDAWYWKKDLPRGVPVNERMAAEAGKLAKADMDRMRQFLCLLQGENNNG